jgi:uncharacterized protein
MLQNTFLHIPRINRETEIKIWNNDVYSWQDFLDNEKKLKLPYMKKSIIADKCHDSIDALHKKKYDFFSSLPGNQHWRMYSELKEKTCFLDIETTGLSKFYNDITLIGMHSDNGTKIFQKGDNLEKFEDELRKFQMVVTFNGKCFDMPFIKQKFPDVKISQFHADLRYLMADLGFRGGLKSIEKQRGIARDDELEGVDGFEAVRLWHKFKKGDEASLQKLRKYLTADVENLKILMDKATVELKQKHFYDVIG